MTDIQCGTTHYMGCACHEARRDKELAGARAELDQARAEIADWKRRRETALRIAGAARAQVAMLVEALKFSHAHLESMDNYSIVSGTRGRIEMALSSPDLAPWLATERAKDAVIEQAREVEEGWGLISLLAELDAAEKGLKA